MASKLNLTEQAQLAIQSANALAAENANSVAGPLHLSSALLAPGSLFNSILAKAGADPTIVEREVARAIVRLPSVDPAPALEDISLSPRLSAVIRSAQEIMTSKNDSFLSQDHLIIALCDEPNIAGILKQAGTTPESVKKAAHGIRGGKKVDSANAEENFEALSKYAIDLTALAADGKLDPVIGRDSEIRRTIRILSRRTKNNPILIGEPGVGKSAIAEGLAQRIGEFELWL